MPHRESVETFGLKIIIGLEGEGAHEMAPDFQRLHNDVMACTRCPRLVKYRSAVAQKKKREFRNWKYWGRPVPPFGDRKASLVIVGLAPAAHGGNRTGRMFTGDGSARFLVSNLFDYGFASKPTSEHVNDGLEMKDTYLTAIVKCAPPQNKPTRKEIDNCRGFLSREFALLTHAKVVLTLGRMAFDGYKSHIKRLGFDVKGLGFRHGACYHLGKATPVIYCSYHPSRQNTQTRRLTTTMFSKVLARIRCEVDSHNPSLR